MSEHTKSTWCPDFCPITGRPFFMWIEHYVTGEMVPTYGGPFDSYTIPEKDSDGEYICERYDHDRGGWIAEEFECVGVQIVSDQLYTCEDDPSEIIKQRNELLAAQQWQPIETAPKSTADGHHIHGIYILGYCPEPDACNLESCVCVVWWEPLMNGGKGMWFGEGSFETHPTHWMPLPAAPAITSVKGGAA